MKRIIASALVLGVFSLIGLVGCGDTDTKKDTPTTTPPPAGGGPDAGKGAGAGGAPDAGLPK